MDYRHLIERTLYMKIENAEVKKNPEFKNNTELNNVEFFKKNGYVVLEDCLPKEYIAKLRVEFMKHMSQKVSNFNLTPIKPIDGRDKANNNVKIDFRPEGGNHDLNRWNMHLPTDPIFLNENLIAHPKVLNVIDSLAGKDSVAFILASDTPYPGSGFQNIHQDFPRFGFTVNIPLVDFEEENAPLELWPGTHIRRGENSSNAFHTHNVNLTKEEINAIAKEVPSKRMLIKAGSILIRDHRLVHRGTANTSNSPRPCISIWYKNVEDIHLANLTIPIPHRPLCDFLSKYALKMRTEGRGEGGYISNKKLLNLGNLFGRIVEEFSASDRDYRRVIPLRVWNTFSNRMKHLLRFSSVENSSKTDRSMDSNAPRSLIGSLILLTTAIVFMIAGFYLKTIVRIIR